MQMAQEQDTRKQATHVGRFKKFARGKCVKGYSSNDLTAILGGGGQLQRQQVSAAPWLSHKLQGHEPCTCREQARVSVLSFSQVACHRGGAASGSHPFCARAPLADWREGVFFRI